MNRSSALLLLASCTAVLASPGLLHYCNRGFCYTKKEPLDPSTMHVSSRRGRRSGLNFCTDSGGHVQDCELFEILGTDPGEFEAVECTSSACKRTEEETLDHHTQGSSQIYSTMDGEVLEIMDLDETEKTHVSWKERPKRGRCYDSALGYEFDCNLVEILDEGLVLIEDLRAGGIFAAQPKSGFSTREGKNQHAPVRTPQVMNGSGLADVREDFRTNVNLNLEGI